MKDAEFYKNLTISALVLIDAANCPQCGDRSGAYYSNDGNVCQCQWCSEVDDLKNELTPITNKG